MSSKEHGSTLRIVAVKSFIKSAKNDGDMERQAYFRPFLGRALVEALGSGVTPAEIRETIDHVDRFWGKRSRA